MSLRMDCFELENLTEDEESIRALLATAVHEGKPIKAYSGLYFNKWYHHLQIITGAILHNEEKNMSLVSYNAHCAGDQYWKCRVKEKITPSEDSELDMRLLVEPVTDDEHDSKSFTVVEVMNADILPSYAPGEIINLQVIAKADCINFYADEDALTEAEGQKVSLPMGMNGEREEKIITIAPGYPMPSAFMNNHIRVSEEDNSPSECAEDDKWIYLRGEMILLRNWHAEFDTEKEKIKWRLPAIQIETYFGGIDIMFNAQWIKGEQKELVKENNIVSTICEIQGDTLIFEYENGMVINKKNNMMAVRYAFSSGRMKRLLPIMTEDCRFSTEAYENGMEIVGKEEIIRYLEEKYRHITVDEKCREFTAYGVVIRNEDDPENKHREVCIAVGLEDEDSEGWSQFLFLNYEEDEEKICSIRMGNAENYEFIKAYESWEEMNEALKL